MVDNYISLKWRVDSNSNSNINQPKSKDNKFDYEKRKNKKHWKTNLKICPTLYTFMPIKS